VTVQYLSGNFCDVAVWIDGRLLAGTADGPIFRCFLEAGEIWRQAASEPLMYGRVAVQGQKFLSIHQGHNTGQCWLVGEGMVLPKGPTFGTQPVGLDAHEAYIVRSGTVYDRVGLISQQGTSGAPGSSQGLSDVQPDGTLWWADVHRTMTINGTVFHYPNVRGPVTVGQVDNGIAAAVGGKTTLVIPSAGAFEPHVCVSPNGRVAICARTGQGAAYVATTIAELGG